MKKAASSPWLLFIHQIPKEPAYLRVKVGRRLSSVGAVAVKNSVYVLPSTDACREDFSWLRREIVDGGGDAVVFEASTVEGLSASDIEQLFREARRADYERMNEKLAALEKRKQSATPSRQAALADLLRIEEQLGEIERIDFFSLHEARGLRERIARLRAALEQRKPASGSSNGEALRVAEHQRRTWVTREGVKVDRIACAWLIRRFIDEDPKFRFVDPAQYVPRKGELRFDMAEGELTHEGDLCSFEVICKRFGLNAKGLARIGEIVHDLDIKDGRYAHPETEGIRVLIQGLVATHASDLERIANATPLFDALCAAEHAAPTRKKR